MGGGGGGGGYVLANVPTCGNQLQGLGCVLLGSTGTKAASREALLAPFVLTEHTLVIIRLCTGAQNTSEQGVCRGYVRVRSCLIPAHVTCSGCGCTIPLVLAHHQTRANRTFDVLF